jgi:5-methyltetrahydropteroyltriglutamate--homocysteine methyltransferase
VVIAGRVQAPGNLRHKARPPPVRRPHALIWRNPRRAGRVSLLATGCEAAYRHPGGGQMPRYPSYTTTVIGAHSVPRWYEALDRLVTMGQLHPADLGDAQFRAMQAAILEQEIAGIDVVTGGEMHRRSHNRHSPPNAMLNHFWQKIPAFHGVTRPKPITEHDPNVTHPAATCTGPIPQSIDLGLVEEFKTVSEFARQPVKVTMTGPHLLAAVAYDEHYGDVGRMMLDLAKLLRHNFQLLAAAGCKHIQIDEPYLTPVSDNEVGGAVLRSRAGL